MAGLCLVVSLSPVLWPAGALQTGCHSLRDGDSLSQVRRVHYFISVGIISHCHDHYNSHNYCDWYSGHGNRNIMSCLSRAREWTGELVTDFQECLPGVPEGV